MSQAAASLKLNFEVPALTVENMLEARVHMGHKVRPLSSSLFLPLALSLSLSFSLLSPFS